LVTEAIKPILKENIMTEEEKLNQNLKVWSHFNDAHGAAPNKQVLKPSEKLSKSLKKLGLTPEEAKIFTGNK